MQTKAFDLMQYPVRLGTVRREVATFQPTPSGSSRVVGRIVAPEGSEIHTRGRGLVLKVPKGRGAVGEFFGLTADEALEAARKGQYGLRFEQLINE